MSTALKLQQIAQDALVIAEDVAGLSTAKDAIIAAIEGKNVPVPAGTKLAQLPPYITSIEGGGVVVDDREIHTIYLVDHTGIVDEIPVRHGDDVVLPSPVVYDNLVFATYHGQMANITEDGIVAAMYDTLNDYTYVQLRLSRSTGTSSITFRFSRTSSDPFRVYWGHESSPGIEDYTEVTLTGTFTIIHSFPGYGDYLVRCVYQGDYVIGVNTTNHGFVESAGGNILTTAIRKLYASKWTRLERYCLYTQYSLEQLVIAYSATWTTLLEGTLVSVRSLKSLILPPSINTISGTSPRTIDNVQSLRVFYCASEITASQSSFMSDASSLLVATLEKVGPSFSQSYMAYNCSSLLFVKLPDTITAIGSYGFEGCHRAKFNELPAGILSLGYHNFYKCFAAEFSVIPSNITSLGSGCFGYCKNLKYTEYFRAGNILEQFSFTGLFKEITVTDGNIGTYGFRDMEGLETITFNMTSPGGLTFSASSLYNLFALRELIFTSLTPPTITTTSFPSSGVYVIYVPDAAVDTYKAATNWPTYSSRIQPISKRTVV